MLNDDGYYAGGDLHRLTEYPQSLVTLKNSTYDLAYLERELFKKIEQLTPSDTDRFRPILKIWRTYSSTVNPEDDLASVDKENFRSILALLGLFATPDQSDALFDRYDVNGDGDLTVHEFLSRCRPRDFDHVSTKFVLDSAGRRTYPEHKLMGRYVPPVEPDVYGFNLRFIKQELTKKLEGLAPINATHSIPRARKDLAQKFERYDKNLDRYVNMRYLKRAMEDMHFGMHESHYDALMDLFLAKPKHGESERLFDYPKFVVYVYPSMGGEKGRMTLDLDYDGEKRLNAYAASHWLQDDMMKFKELSFMEDKINSARALHAEVYGTDYQPVNRYFNKSPEEEEEKESAPYLPPTSQPRAQTAHFSTRPSQPISKTTRPARPSSSSSSSKPATILPPATSNRNAVMNRQRASVLAKKYKMNALKSFTGRDNGSYSGSLRYTPVYKRPSTRGWR